MRAATILAVLLPAIALAQPSSAGVGVRKSDLYTLAPVTLYVDPVGNDTKPCTGTGTAACKTLAGVVTKIPPLARHNITINIASGTYPEAFDFQPRVLLDRGTTLSVIGTLVPSTLASGTNAGTTTAATGGSQSGPCSVSDSTQAWTVNDLRSRMVTFASGALAGQTHAITSNTATSFTIANFVSPGVGVAYSIVEPGVIFNGGTTSARIANILGPGTTVFSGIHVTRGAGQTGVMQAVVDGTSPTTFTNCKFTGHATNSLTLQVLGCRVSLTRSIVHSVSTSAAISYSASGVASVLAGGSLTSVFATATSNAAVSGFDWEAPAFSSVVAEGGGTTVGAVNLSGISHRAFAASLWITCTGGGIGWSTAAVGSSISDTSLATNGVLRIQNCGTGVLVQGPSYWVLNGITFDTVTTAVAATRSAKVDFIGTTPTFVGVTNELSLDGAFSTFAALAALPAPQAITNLYGTTILR